MMLRRLALPLLLLAAASCATRSQSALPSIVDSGPTPSSRVVLVSFDGVGFDALQNIEAQLGTDGWNRMRREGTAARLIPVDPTLTSVTHVSMATGAIPSQTGIVSNVLHLPGTAADEWKSGFDVEIEVEAIWVAAMRAGKRVGVITYPGVDGRTPDRTADFGLIYTQPVARSRFQELGRSDFGIDTDLSRHGSFSPIRAAVVAWEWKTSRLEVKSPVRLIALDSTNDGLENYDEFLIRHGDSEISVDDRGWFPLSAELADGETTSLFGAWSKVLRFEPDLSSVTLYWGPVSRNVGYPESFRKMIDREVGFWPGPPDGWTASQWIAEKKGIDPATFGEQLARFSDFFTRATLLAMQRMQWDLLLTYQPIVDEAGHQWHIVSERQSHATPENLEAAAAMSLHAHRVFDSAVARLDAAVPPSDNLVIVSDHGMEALHTMVRINRLLVEWGYGTAGESGRLSAGTRWATYPSGAFATFHSFGPETAGELEALVTRLEALRSPGGEKVFDLVEIAGPDANLRSGRIQAWLAPGFGFTSSTSGEIFSPSIYYGQHGYLSRHPSMHAIVAARGPSVGSLPETVLQTSIARWLAQMLGVPPPAAAN
ncbi:MAG: alkaline phosphatase family protein [Thermoanaerobaculia bacterium]